MNLFLALFWFVCAVVLLAYERFMGGAPFRFRLGDVSFSWVWVMLVLALYNLARWQRYRVHQTGQRAAETMRVARKWKKRRFSDAPPSPPDPHFNFSDEPPSPPRRDITERPPPAT